VTGAYVESDPIGLEGGLNEYTYVAGNPIRSRIRSASISGSRARIQARPGNCWFDCKEGRGRREGRESLEAANGV